ncbi:hypothetical protein F5B19DRAFT_149634 [Rostrohypoxylon terebratum]|nr:hypothetical protein F5B19DRAFT_149634 [Rostrohypoxylon terebratum]
MKNTLMDTLMGSGYRGSYIFEYIYIYIYIYTELPHLLRHRTVFFFTYSRAFSLSCFHPLVSKCYILTSSHKVWCVFLFIPLIISLSPPFPFFSFYILD